jgi:hypothetical protein
VIRYTLACSKGHEFETWFAGSEAFEDQQARGLLVCPVCGTTSVDRALMAPAVSTARAKESVPVAANVPDKSEPESAELVKALRKLRKHLTENADYVGTRFAEEARKIHYEEVEKRSIYGEATPEDVRALAEEEIEFHPLPPLPEDNN